MHDVHIAANPGATRSSLVASAPPRVPRRGRRRARTADAGRLWHEGCCCFCNAGIAWPLQAAFPPTQIHPQEYDVPNRNHDQGNQGDGSRSKGRGFAGMEAEQQRQIASAGGRAAHASGHAHEFTSEEARQAGRKGGEARSQRSRDNSDRDIQEPSGGGTSTRGGEQR
jgi:uncharacterized protein